MGPEREVSNAELAEDIAALRGDLRAFRLEFLPREVYHEARKADEAELKHLEYRLNVMEQRGNANRQLALGSFILPVLVIIIGGLLLVALGAK